MEKGTNYPFIKYGKDYSENGKIVDILDTIFYYTIAINTTN